MSASPGLKSNSSLQRQPLLSTADEDHSFCLRFRDTDGGLPDDGVLDHVVAMIDGLWASAGELPGTALPQAGRTALESLYGRRGSAWRGETPQGARAGCAGPVVCAPAPSLVAQVALGSLADRRAGRRPPCI